MASHRALPQKPHVLCFPVPVQSHIKAMLNLAKLLHHRGCHVSFVNTEFNHRRLLEVQGSDILDNLPPDFQFLAIPDGLPPLNANATQDVQSLCYAARHNMGSPLRELIAELNNKAAAGSDLNSVPVTFIVSDGFMTFSADPSAEEFGIPIVYLWTVPACALMGFMQFRALKEKGLAPLKDESYLTNGYLDTPIDWIPGMKNMRLRDIPSFIRTTNADDVAFNFFMDSAARADRATATIIHTYEAIETDVLRALSTILPGPVHAIGPFQLLLNRIPEQENHLKHVMSNLWKEDRGFLKWLDLQKPDSVVYVNFGSMVFITPQQLIEFAMGIANSNYPFLWIIRPDLVIGNKGILPVEFSDAMKERGWLCDWCPQEEVLNHPSVGGFLTHCGWNSTIESLLSAVPMLCWPWFGDQMTNCKYICKEWEVGFEIESDVKRDEVERLLRELMEGLRKKQLKKRAIEWKKLAEEATTPHGSSYVSLDKLLSDSLGLDL